MTEVLKKWPLTLAMFLLINGAQQLHALTLPELQHDRHLTPESLLHRFSGFEFKLFDEVQPRDKFLATQTGDCDDFATLAAEVLRQKGYTTRLIAVFMTQQTHVVCYVKEAGAYLDYNNRKKASPLVPTSGALPDIAAKVARSFRTPWTSVMEFTFEHGIRKAGAMDFPQN
ncbi:MAG: hypothetical protein JWR69_723 [Pedosphaera sp.]|nr:hypothetical protein [Pedosphaera sp.]